MIDSIHAEKNRQQFSILRSLQLLCEPNQVYELRCFETKRSGTVSGYFDDLELMAQNAEFWTGAASGVYLTLNPVRPELRARAYNRAKIWAKATTTDQEVTHRRRLLLDFDAVIPAGIGSTAEEHAAAMTRADRCRHYLATLGWPEPIFADSGNGAHLVYAIDLPNDEASTRLVEAVLKALSAEFTDEIVKVDLSVSNASRLTKVYGTLACKGDNLPERPHRQSGIFTAPEKLVAVPRELLEQVAIEQKATVPAASGLDMSHLHEENAWIGGSRGDVDPVAWVESFLTRHKIGVRQTKESTDKWQRRWVLEQCPFCQSQDTAAAITIDPDGKIGFRCQHNRCSEPRKHWDDFRQHFEPDGDGTAEKTREKTSRLTRLVDHVCTHCNLVVDDTSEEALALVPGQGWRPVESKSFEHWLVDSYRASTGQIVRSSDLSDAQLNISASCRDRRHSYHRVAAQDGNIYLDLCRGDGRAVQITPEGWSVIENPPVVFLTKKDMAALPVPEAGGTIDELRTFLNFTDADFALYLGFLLDALKGRQPYSILVVNGEQGSAKTTATTFTAELLDPCKKAKTKSLPKDLRELAVLANNRHLLAFDNISRLSPETSDALCRLATGSGMVVRSLYSNAEEQVFGGARPVLLNGIPEIGDRSDLLGRTVKITLQAIPDDKRVAEKTLMQRFEARRPLILGALYTLLSNGLQHQGQVKAERMPRMADTYMWLRACEARTGLHLANVFADNLKENVRGLALETILGRSLEQFMAERGEDHFWEGKPNALHDELRNYWNQACGSTEKEKATYPGNAQALSSRLNEIMASLRENGIVIKRERTATGRTIRIDARAYFKKQQQSA